METVSTQAQLEKALKDSKLDKIVLKTDKEAAFKIPAGEYKKVELVVDAPNADVENEGVFKSVRIKNIKPSTWKEKAKGNNLVVTAKNARVVVEKGASVGKITLTADEAKVAVEVNGKVESVVVDAKAEVALSGKTGKLDVVMTEFAAGSEVTSSVSVNLTSAVDVNVTLEKGAEGSKVTVTDDKAKVTLDNQSKSTVVVGTPSGNQTVGSGQSSTVGNAGNTGNTGSSSSGNSSSGGMTSKKYDLEDYAEDLKITPDAELYDKGMISVDGWEIRLKEAVDPAAEVTVSGNTVLVGEKVILTLSEQTAITGLDKNGGEKKGTAKITWYMRTAEQAGIYKVIGKLNMPAGWANTYERGISLTLVVSGQLTEDLYKMVLIDDRKDDFVLTPKANDSFKVTVTGGAITIKSEAALDGGLLKIVNGELKYGEEIIGTMPSTVGVKGENLKKENDYKYEGFKIDWWEDLEFINGTNIYTAIANIEEKESWINMNGEAAVMKIVLISGSTVVKDIAIWDAEDAAAYANDGNCPDADINAAVATGSAVKVVGEVKVEADPMGRIAVTYTLGGELPAFEVEGLGKGHHLLFSIEKTTGGQWTDGDLTPIEPDGNYTYPGADNNKLIVRMDIKGMERIILCWDVDGDETLNEGDVVYIIDVSGVTLK